MRRSLSATCIHQTGTPFAGIAGFRIQDIIDSFHEFRDKQCVYCCQRSAPIKCCRENCDRWFHYICGYKNECLTQFCGAHESFCDEHLPEEYENPPQTQYVECEICFEQLPLGTDANYNPVAILQTCRVDECPPGLMHRDCLQQFAFSAGYHFKCPSCLSKDFKKDAEQHACSVLEETVQRNQGQEDFVADIKLEEGSTDQQDTEIVEDGEGEFKLEAETHHDGSADQHGTAPVAETGLVLLQEAAVLVAEESQTNLLVIEEPCDLVQEEGYEKQTTNEISECWETIEHPYDISTHDAYPDEEIVLEEYTEVAAGIDTYDEFESMVDEDEEETDSGMTGNYIDCPDCGKLVTVRYLPKHRETHTSTQRHECPVCQLRFTFAENLAKHKRIHQNDKRYACPYCQKLFLHWASRRYHIERVHTKEKRFAFT
uniref:C2H2-type domain-containing protein n=1 Tax=Anopheles atroparvus TaxID=41427 RepID=A0A182IU28_ANOAO